VHGGTPLSSASAADIEQRAEALASAASLLPSTVGGSMERFQAAARVYGEALRRLEKLLLAPTRTKRGRPAEPVGGWALELEKAEYTAEEATRMLRAQSPAALKKAKQRARRRRRVR